MKKAVKGFALGASILAISLSSGLLASTNSLVNGNNVVSINNKEVVETKLAADFIVEFEEYNWHDNQNTFKLEYDVDFTGFSYEEAELDRLHMTDSKIFDGQGHRFFIEDSENQVSWGNGFFNDDLEEGYLFDSITNATFKNVVFDGIGFVFGEGTNVTFENIVYENVIISGNQKKLMSTDNDSTGFFLNEADNIEVENFIARNITIENNIISAYSLDSTNPASYKTSLFGEVADFNANGIFVDNFNYVNNTLETDEETFDFSFDGNILVSEFALDKDAYVENAYFSNISSSFGSLTSNISADLNLISSKNRRQGNYRLSDVLVDNSISNSNDDIDFFGGSDWKTNSTYVVYDSNERTLSSHEDVSFYTEEDMYSTPLFWTILGDVPFILQKIGERPTVITDDSVVPQILYIYENTSFTKTSQVVGYTIKSFFNDFSDDVNDYQIGIRRGNKVFKEQGLGSKGTIAVDFSKIGSKELFIKNEATNEVVYTHLIWKSNPWFLVWIILITILILIILVLSFILVSFKKQVEESTVKEPKEKKQGKKDKKPKQKKQKNEEKVSKVKGNKSSRVKKARTTKKAQDKNKAKSNKPTSKKIPREDEYFYFQEEKEPSNVSKQQRVLVTNSGQKEEDLLSSEDLENIERLLDN